MRQLAAGPRETLARPEDGLLEPRRGDAPEHLAQLGGRRGDQGRVAFGHWGGEVSGHRDRTGNRNFGEITEIAPTRPDGGCQRRVARPEADAVPSCERDRQGRTPRSRAENCDVQLDAPDLTEFDVTALAVGVAHPDPSGPPRARDLVRHALL